MMKRLTFLKTKLQWCTTWGRDKKVQAQNELALRLRMWGTIGYLKYQFRVDALKQVMTNMKRIGQVPKGYMYPELHSQSEMPAELYFALARKRLIEAHQNNKE